MHVCEFCILFCFPIFFFFFANICSCSGALSVGQPQWRGESDSIRALSLSRKQSVTGPMLLISLTDHLINQHLGVDLYV